MNYLDQELRIMAAARALRQYKNIDLPAIGRGALIAAGHDPSLYADALRVETARRKALKIVENNG